MITDVSRPHLSGKSISQVLQLPAGTQEDSKDHEADVDMEEKSGNSWYKEEAELPPSNPPVVYPALESPHSSRPHVGGKTLAHMPPAIEEDGEHGDQDADMGSTSDQVSDEEDNESTVSAGNNLRDDLASALQGDFEFKGNYAHASSLLLAPNPGLHIEGLGVIGLPLSDRDAKLIVGCAKQAPIGHGDRTVVDTEVRDTFEVEPAQVKFLNPAWDEYIAHTLPNSIWSELGVGPCTTAPRCELYKLLLYQTGSRLLPHQDNDSTKKADGMFATVIIVLPSFYTGGQVHVSHGSSNKIFDLASTNAFNTSILAWYTDVMHEVKPIHSGYRLALSYNLIHTSPGIPLPTLSDMHSAVSRLRRVLRKWSKDGYEEDDDSKLVAYILEHQYSHDNLKMGALKGKDRHMISDLKGVADELNFNVCLASLKYVEYGDAEDCGEYPNKRGRFCYDDDDGNSDSDEEYPKMGEVEGKTLTISNLVTLDGKELLPGKTLSLNDTSLIPKNAFEGQSPDDTKCEDYPRDARVNVEHFYHRTVLVLIPKENQVEILLSAGGVPYALKIAQSANPARLTQDDRSAAHYIIDYLGSQNDATKVAMADLAVRWNDLKMWKQVLASSSADKNINILRDEIFPMAWRKFSFEAIRVILETSLPQLSSLKSQLDFITYISSQATGQERDDIINWCNTQTSRSFAALKSPTTKDVPIFISVIQSKGISFFSDILLPQLVQLKSIYNFWVDFIPSFHQQANDLSKLVTESLDADASKALVREILEISFNAAVREWDAIAAPQNPAYGYSYGGNAQQSASTTKISRICRLIDIGMSIGHIKTCEALLDMVIKSPGDVTAKFTSLYIPLIPELRSTLSKHQTGVSTQPFAEFFRIVIGAYLEEILGKNPGHDAPLPNARTIGCGNKRCKDCKKLNRLLASRQIKETFRGPVKSRNHMQQILDGAKDLFGYTVAPSGTPHGLTVTKQALLITSEQWKSRQKDAESFLASIGDDGTIAIIMGNRKADVVSALGGNRQYRMGAIPAATQSASTGAAASHSTTKLVPSLPPTPVVTLSPPIQSTPLANPNSSRVASKKRKKTPHG